MIDTALPELELEHDPWAELSPAKLAWIPTDPVGPNVS